MKSVNELYSYLNERIPSSLSEEWDNDGLMVACSDKPAGRVLIVLDVTDEAVAYAVEGGFDVIVSHHPLIFSPLRSLVSDKLLTIVRNDIAVFSFHTRLDACEPGVNDALAYALGLYDIESRGILRTGKYDRPVSAGEFAEIISEKLGSASVTAVIDHDPVERIALLGGSGKDLICEARACGADTFLTGEVSYNAMSDAKDEKGLNIFAAGHFETEFPVCALLEKMIKEYDRNIFTEVKRFNNLIAI